MDVKERFSLIIRIVERAEAMGIGIGDRITRMLDMQYADKQFNLALSEFLAADDENFAHDFTGIQANMNRSLGKCKVENYFVPRFAGHYHTKEE